MTALADAKTNLDKLTNSMEEYKREKETASEDTEHSSEKDKAKSKGGILEKTKSLTSDVLSKGFRVALLPVTASLGVISGAVTGIWNSHLMGVAKTAAMLSMLIIGFDIIKIGMENIRISMEDKLSTFGEGGQLTKGLTSLIEFWESAKKYFNSDYQSKWLDDSKVDFISLAKLAWQAGLDLFSDGLKYLWATLLAMTKNSLKIWGTDHTTESELMLMSERNAKNISKSNIDIHNVDDYIHSKTRGEQSNIAKSVFRFQKNDMGNEKNREGAIDPSLHMHGGISGGLFSLDRGVDTLTDATKNYLMNTNSSLSEDEATKLAEYDVKTREIVYGKIDDFNKTLNNTFEDKDKLQEFLEIASESMIDARKFDRDMAVKFEELASNSGLFLKEKIEYDGYSALKENIHKNGNPTGIQLKKLDALEGAGVGVKPSLETVGEGNEVFLKELYKGETEWEKLNETLTNFAKKVEANNSSGGDTTVIQNNNSSTISNSTPSGFIPVYGSAGGFNNISFGQVK